VPKKLKTEWQQVGTIFKKLSKQAGVTVNLEPEWKFVGQIINKNGKKTYFSHNSFDLNTLGASRVVSDKDYANYFLKLLGYPVILGKSFYSNKWAKAIKSKRNIQAAYAYAQQLGFPLIVKPNSKSQGQGVTKVYNKQEFFKALRTIFEYDKIVLVQKNVTGNDYRIVVLDNQVLSAYQRLPLSIIGDGKLSVRALLEKKQKLFIKLKRDTKINFRDSRIKNKLSRQGLNWSSIIKKNQLVYLLDNANLSSGGDAIDVTGKLHPSVKKLAIKLTVDMGLRYSGVDLMIEGLATKPLKKYHVIELNDTPGIDNYFAGVKKQKQVVEKLYLQVLKALYKTPKRA
jgi:D-alanine-D-alanine ligase-like ATP-grasp enzyme